MCSFSPLALHQVHDQLTHQWEQLSIKAAVLRSNLDAIAEFPVAFDHVTRELDHYSPQLGQFLEQQGFHGSDASPSSTASSVFAWKHVPPLLPLASRRKKIPLLARDTGDSVDEKKSKVLERKRRRDEQEGGVVDGAEVRVSVQRASTDAASST